MCEGFFTADMTLGEARQTFRKLLAECDNAFVRQTPTLDADVIICHFAGISRTHLLTHGDEQISFFLAEELSLALGQRLSGLPVAYITNEKEFYGRPFYVDQNVLIPKPDTELLVELAVADARRRMPEKRQVPSQPAALRIADICTGSGCIAISLLLELAGEPGDGPRRVVATDLSSDALRVAGKNIEKLVPDALRARISLLEGDLCAPLDESVSSLFDIIVSNPPYVPASVTDELLSDGRGEPRLALDGDTDAALDLKADGGLAGNPASEKRTESGDGLAIVRRLGPQVLSHLVPGGSFFLETGEYNAEAAAAYLESVGFTDVRIHKDLSGQLRVTEARRPL